MRSYNQKSKNNIIIGSLLGVILLMTIGYAAFSSVLKIKGTSGISSNWDVRITNVTSKNIVGKATNAKEPKWEALTASVEVNLESPGDSIEYDITVENKGTINAKLDKINLSDSNNPAVKFTTSGLTEGNKLKTGESAVLTLKVEYLEGVALDPDNMSATVTVTLEYSQANVNSEGIAVPELSASETLTENVVTSGDGLYEDTTETGRYVYKGANPNNYINIETTSGTESYRIVSVENDGTVKIVRTDNIGNRVFEQAKTRIASYCNNNTYGCAAWGSSSTMLDSAGNNVTSMKILYNETNTYSLPTEESQMTQYLNTTYYNTLSEGTKAVIDNHTWNVGPLDKSSKTLVTSMAEEAAYKWKGKVGLIYPTDYVKASTNASCTTIASANSSSNKNCQTNNYLQATYMYWTMAPYGSNGNSCDVWFVSSYGTLSASSANISYGVRPVLFLTSDISLDGEGTAENPYTIIS